jgi:Glyoxalase-like domain
MPWRRRAGHTLSHMAIARFKQVVLDAGDVARLGEYWAAALNRTWRAKGDSYGYMTGPTAGHTVWVNAVPEPKTAKNRVHWDVTVPSADSVAALVSAGATVLREPDEDIYWHILADPEGNEFCVFKAK